MDIDESKLSPLRGFRDCLVDKLLWAWFQGVERRYEWPGRNRGQVLRSYFVLLVAFQEAEVVTSEAGELLS